MFKIKKQNNFTMLLAVLLVILLLWKYIINNTEEIENPEELKKELNKPIEQQQKKEEDLYKWVSKGDRNNTVKKVQKRLQLISKYVCKNDVWKAKADNDDFRWLNTIYNLYKDKYQEFKVDGIFGTKTDQFVNIVMGKKGTNIFLLRKKYLDIVNLIKSL